MLIHLSREKRFGGDYKISSDYIDTIIEYTRDFLFGEAMRIMSIDYTSNNFNYYTDKKTGDIKELSNKIKSNLLSALNKKIDVVIEQLKKYLLDNQIDSPEEYRERFEEIKGFLYSLINKQAESIQKLFKNLEGSE